MLCSKLLHNMYISPNIREMKLRRMQCAVYVVYMGKLRLHKKIQLEHLKGGPLIDKCVEGKVILK